ncbi:hypothetical protein HS7_14190 [Sulfolobales archaeon HS-7]|nr:hypothetical protein HS7_14190 [Sulfolobales archaeon HS-7]
MGLLIRPIEPVFFRWYGEYSPNFSGPMNKGISEPLPLVSTVLGAIYRKYVGIKTLTPQNEIQEFEKTFVDVWGPVIYVKGVYAKRETQKGEFIMVHDFPGKLLLLEKREDRVVLARDEDGNPIKIEPAEINRIGIGRDLGRGSSKEHMLYSSKLEDLNATVIRNFKEVETWGIYLEMPISFDGVIEIGGEGRVAKVSEVSLSLNKGGGKSVLVSPALIPLTDNVRITSLDDVLKLKVDDVEVKDILMSGKLGVIGTGFSMSVGARRPMYPAILPGAILKVNAKRKLGELSKLGWGSLLQFDEGE